LGTDMLLKVLSGFVSALTVYQGCGMWLRAFKDLEQASTLGRPQ
jgi:hypothetical protein